MTRRPILAVVGILALLIAVALPVLAANPNAPGQANKAAKGEKVAKVAITLNGSIALSTGADGKETYTLAEGGTTYTLEAGPAWFFGEKYPLKPFVGESVTVVGKVAAGSTEVDVESIDGTALRAAGKPPWAGGWKRVGALHPGWSQEKADKLKARFGDCFPPGQCKDKAAKPAKADRPGESESPD